MTIDRTLQVDYSEPALDFEPPKLCCDASSFVNGTRRIPTPAELRRARAELDGRVPSFMIKAYQLYTNLRVLHPEMGADWALEKTYRRIPESNPVNIVNYKPAR